MCVYVITSHKTDIDVPVFNFQYLGPIGMINSFSDIFIYIASSAQFRKCFGCNLFGHQKKVAVAPE